MTTTNNIINTPSAIESTTTTPRILTGTDDFKKLLLHSDVFVDKSLLIKEIIEDSGDVVLITRPRRWGKSLNMDMIEKFLNIEVDSQGNRLPIEQRTNHKLFSGGEIDLGLSTGRTKILKKLNIAEYSSIMTEYQGQFPVISISFKDVKGSNYQEIEDGVKEQVLRAYSRFNYLATRYLDVNNNALDAVEKEKLSSYFSTNLSLVNLKSGLRFLSELLFKHFEQKVYILIDEYDTPINSSYLKFGHKSEEFEQVLELFRTMFGTVLKTNPYLEKAVLTGILRVAKANLFGSLRVCVGKGLYTIFYQLLCIFAVNYKFMEFIW